MKPILRIPIARLGRWFHPVYKNRKGEPVVEFTQEDFDSMKQAFLSDDRGYEPYLTYGHVKQIFDKTTADGFPVEAHLKKLEQVDDVLYGEFEPNNEEVVDQIASGKYRYASGEFVWGAPSKETNDKIKVFLKGVALTNTPFVPKLPRNTVKHVSESLNEFVLLSDYVPLEETELTDNKNCTKCGEELADNAETCTACVDHKEDKVVEACPENTTSDVVEKTEEQEVKSLLSDILTKLGDIFGFVTTKANQQDEAMAALADAMQPKTTEVEEVITSDEKPSEADQETVIEEINNVEDNKADNVAEAAVEMEQQLRDALAKLEALEAEKAELANQAQALSDKAAAYEQERLEAEQAAREQRLSDEVANLTNEFKLAPAVADKVRMLVSANVDSTIKLSDENEVKFEDALLGLVKDLLSAESIVDTDQVGATSDVANLSDDANDPWAEFRAKYNKPTA